MDDGGTADRTLPPLCPTEKNNVRFGVGHPETFQARHCVSDKEKI